MTRKRRTLHQERYHRPILNEVLPFEVPPTFTNGGYFSFCNRINLKIERSKKKYYVKYENAQAADKAIIDVLFPNNSAGDSLSIKAEITRKNIKQWGKNKVVYSEQTSCFLNTKPLTFEIAHRGERSRELSIPHPRNQLDVWSCLGFVPVFLRALFVIKETIYVIKA